MGAFIKILLVGFGIYFLSRALIRGLFGWFIDSAQNNTNARIQRQKEEFIRQKKRQEGRITINYNPELNKGFDKDEGDYVDFEEVK